ncbi:Outer-membrane lipoprotein carrier protein [Fundidesulfovibrio magnetotacticus]|uniref:Outer-membrane lipoprotein carrier protein n=1 Tax=Fundidesulfovibrio magnetotacticus TaxID=2730080 RepID=A0A6V8LXZ9_9BACT|nr:outer membrane lipoprotein carrier protein LolA [Fundidesulfovibrio magnetotacticus]GFK94527.1 Outer-membrane lipoprotein carrier protein [Fundidesulfovibrio magnetotacticus]
MTLRVLCALCALLCSANALAADVAGLPDKVQKQYQSVTSFSADFTQVLVNAASKERETRTGKLVFSQPALIRWETERPEKELLIVGKDAAWNVFPGEKTAYRYAVEDILGSKTMLRFLSGKGNLREDFHVSQEPEAPQGQAQLKLVPREAEPGLVLAHAWVDLKTNMLARIVIEDFYGNLNDVTLENLKTNPAVPKDFFQYAPPKDFTILDNAGMQDKPKP